MNGDPRESTVIGMNKRSGDRMNKKACMWLVWDMGIKGRVEREKVVRE